VKSGIFCVRSPGLNFDVRTPSLDKTQKLEAMLEAILQYVKAPNNEDIEYDEDDAFNKGGEEDIPFPDVLENKTNIFITWLAEVCGIFLRFLQTQQECLFLSWTW